MYNYHTGLVWQANKILLSISVFLSMLILVYAAVKEAFIDRRSRSLEKLKKNLQDLSLLGKEAVKDGCANIVNKSSPKQFLDIVRYRDLILPKEFEGQFRDCLLAYGKIAKIEKIALKSKNKWRRIQAIISLGYALSPPTLEILKASLYDKDEDISYFSMLALGQIKNRISAKILLDFLGKRIYSGYKIVSILETFPGDIIDEVIKATESRDPFVRFWSLKLISKFKPSQHIKRIEALAQDESPDVRAAACECLGELGMREAKFVLLLCLKDAVWFVRMHAVRALLKVSKQECIPEIISLINDGAWLVRDSVKKAMAQNVEAALPYIEGLLYSDNETVRRDCAEVLEESGYLSALFKDIVSQDPKVKSRAIHLLGGIIKSRAHLGLESVLISFAEDMRKNILQVISGFDSALAQHIEKRIKGEVVEA